MLAEDFYLKEVVVGGKIKKRVVDGPKGWLLETGEVGKDGWLASDAGEVG